ncbi:DUF4283 domain protein, partial [Trifolium medium]|nr:DUF4283 domain protein [Trifolium medium]
MDGYHNMRVLPLGHQKVLLSSTVEDEVKEVVGSVGWWCTWFDRFEEWSPELVSNQRSIWLRCFGVPLHAWGEALFRTIAFKYGTFIEVDTTTKIMARGDLARIKIVTDKPLLIDANITILVLGKKFVIKVMEEGSDANDERPKCCGGCSERREVVSSRGSVDGGSALAVIVGSSEEGSDVEWVEGEQERGVTVCDPIISGNPLVDVVEKVNGLGGDTLEMGEQCCVDKDRSKKVVECLGVVPCSTTLSRDIEGEEIQNVGSVEEREVQADVVGPVVFKPIVLRTRSGDIPLVRPQDVEWAMSATKDGVCSFS